MVGMAMYVKPVPVAKKGCPDCKGTGEIKLLVSVSACDCLSLPPNFPETWKDQAKEEKRKLLADYEKAIGNMEVAKRHRSIGDFGSRRLKAVLNKETGVISHIPDQWLPEKDEVVLPPVKNFREHVDRMRADLNAEQAKSIEKFRPPNNALKAIYNKKTGKQYFKPSHSLLSPEEVNLTPGKSWRVKS